MNITLRQLSAFACLARLKSFTKAADELHMTQSSLSGLIKEMERNLDTRLFDRTTRQIHLSEAGERLLPHATRILGDVHMFGNEVDDIRDFNLGKVRIASSQQLSAYAVPQLVKAFKQHYPDILVTLVDCPVDEVASRIASLDADIGIGPDALMQTVDVRASELFISDFRLVIRPDHRWATRDSVCWHELEDGDFITLQECFADDITDELPPEISARHFRSDYRVSFLSTALGMTQANLGMTVSLDYTKEFIEQQGLVMVPIHEPTIHHRFMLYQHKYRAPTSAVKTFERFVIEHTMGWRR